LRIDFPVALTPGRLIKRYKRFLSDIRLDDSGQIVTAHCVNTGRMTSCSTEGSRVWLLPAPEGSKRKLQWTWVMIEVGNERIAGVHTGYPNALVSGAIELGEIEALSGYSEVKREVKMSNKSRVDVLLSGHPDKADCWVEVKNVSMVEDGVARFPDAPTARGKKHLEELVAKIQGGERGAMVYVVQRPDASHVEPADDVDPEYGKALRKAVEQGVEIYALRVKATPTFLETAEMLSVELP
jgi:sugar fermentation stimulation protein A